MLNWKSLVLATAVGLAAVTATAGRLQPQKDEQGFSVYRSAPAEAGRLLDRAVEYMQDNSAARAFAAFNNQAGQFHENDLYVFVVGIGDGVMHAYGGAPEAIVGDQVLDLRDASGMPFVQAMLDAVKREDRGTVDYVWLNRVTNKVEPKTTEVRRVGDYMVGVGYYSLAR
ncbi:MAG: cache domain-containing protein [Rhodocyclaceae bacterium]|nr:cache domain-containing protein [Rhodocyclaceae bacterium]